MKKRLLTALVGVSFAVAWMFTIDTHAYALILTVFSSMAVFELLTVFEVKNIPFRILTVAYSVAVMLYTDLSSRSEESLAFLRRVPDYLWVINAGVILVSLALMVSDHKRLRFEQVVCSLFAAFAIPEAFACIFRLRDVYLTCPCVFTHKADGRFLILFTFFASWFSDGFALFTGMKFGKHKLAPVISPKKTVEGAVGGVIGGTALSCALWAVFKYCFVLSDAISLPFVIITGFVLTTVSILGDLAASAIKRHHNVKDFGNLLPGHGGVLDRFDSSVFVYTVLYGIVYVMWGC